MWRFYLETLLSLYEFQLDDIIITNSEHNIIVGHYVHQSKDNHLENVLCPTTI